MDLQFICFCKIISKSNSQNCALKHLINYVIALFFNCLGKSFKICGYMIENIFFSKEKVNYINLFDLVLKKSLAPIFPVIKPVPK